MILLLSSTLTSFALTEDKLVEIVRNDVGLVSAVNGSIKQTGPARSITVIVRFDTTGKLQFFEGHPNLYDNVYSEKSEFSCNCKTSTIRMLTSVYYSKDGKVIDHEGEPESSGEESFPSDSLSGHIWRFACSSKYLKDVK